MGTVNFELDEGVGIIGLKSGKKNPINPELVADFSEVLKEIINSDDVKSVVLTSDNEKFFSIGLDVPKLIDMEKEEFRAFIRNFNKLCLDLYTISKPTVASINGHAIAGGFILALCCDYRFMGKGRGLVGLNEVKLGVSVPLLPQKILERLAGERIARDMIYSGEFYNPERAFELGAVDGVFESEEVLEKSIEKARNLGEMPERAFQAVKLNRIIEIKELVMKNFDSDVDTFVELWYSDKAQERLREAIKSF